MDLQDLRELKVELTRFMMAYKFALDEMNTKINILKEEFLHIHDYNPIEHVTSRVKSPESILKKMIRKGHELSLSSIRENLKDISGIRITCSFISDIYKISDMLVKQKDVKLITTKDYIQNPKPNGYQSLHLIVEIPIYMSDREVHIPVEIQIRTIAMDFWASLEHKIFYKYNKVVPEKVTNELKEAATTAAELDRKMERLHQEMKEIKILNANEDSEEFLINIDKDTFKLPSLLLESLTKSS
ncbi:GTP pyrophosphokinase [Robertmurraya andreesenii]|uniref:GTP pyrophosphokinase n=1 Tax=Anoxybacillus andreesenii TaxID=1325932 RepID=A0ABT9V113_9BACL|nr:GTP pyrophosphokinase family protein [Robertmurraya andreesenii]MDQ0154575.1 putative GTP pyrophosphokinase [Robertmurraya andreesenii]